MIEQRELWRISSLLIFVTNRERTLLLRTHIDRINTGTPILIGKFDFSDAYKSMTMWGHTSAASCICHENIAYIYLRLTLGGSPCPPLWWSMSEINTNLANDILARADWDPSRTNSPHCEQIPKPNILNGNIPFAKALPANVAVTPLKHGKVDCYIYNLIPVILHSGYNYERATNAVPIATHIIGRPVFPNEPIPWDNLLCFRKPYGEIQTTEMKIITGWGINTRRFLVFLTEDKQSSCSTSIKTIINRGSSTYNDIETLVGHLNHCGNIIPLARHFLHLIRGIMRRSAKKKIKISSKEIRYLHIWKRFLSYAKTGISMNNIVYRSPT